MLKRLLNLVLRRTGNSGLSVAQPHQYKVQATQPFPKFVIPLWRSRGPAVRQSKKYPSSLLSLRVTQTTTGPEAVRLVARRFWSCFIRKFQFNGNGVLVAGMMLASLIPGYASAEIKIGFVNMAVILEKAPQADAARKELEQEFSTREANLTAERAAIKEMKDKLATDGEIMSASKRESLTYNLRKRERDYVRDMDDLKDDFNLRYNELRDKLQNDISKVIVAIAKDEKYDLMVREGVTGVLYASERIDITEKILSKLKRSYRGKRK